MNVGENAGKLHVHKPVQCMPLIAPHTMKAPDATAVYVHVPHGPVVVVVDVDGVVVVVEWVVVVVVVDRVVVVEVVERVVVVDRVVVVVVVGVVVVDVEEVEDVVGVVVVVVEEVCWQPGTCVKLSLPGNGSTVLLPCKVSVSGNTSVAAQKGIFVEPLLDVTVELYR